LLLSPRVLILRDGHLQFSLASSRHLHTSILIAVLLARCVLTGTSTCIDTNTYPSTYSHVYTHVSKNTHQFPICDPSDLEKRDNQ
jgi:Inner spore coat protein D